MSQDNEHIAAESPRPDGHVAALTDDYVHELLDAGRAAEVVRHCKTCPACKAALADARRRLAALRTAPTAEASEGLVRKTIGKVDAHRTARKRRWRRFVGAAAGALAASVAALAWLNVYYANLTASPYDLVVLGQRDLLASTAGSLRVVLRDARTLAPVAGVPVTVRLFDPAAGKAADLASFTTDAHGGGAPRFTLPDWPDGRCELRVTARTPGGTEIAARPVTLKRSFQVMLSTDKPVYQPGQAIRIRSLALRRPDLHPVADRAATFSVVDPKGNVLCKEEEKTSRFGIASADCPLDTEIAEGNYTVLCTTGDVQSRLAVEVKKYVLPKFKVAVTPDRPFYKPGDTIHLTVRADYFFGKPAADAAVKLDVRSDAPGAPPAALQGRTDAQGRATFRYDIPIPPLLGQIAVPSDAAPRVHFLATVTDSAGQTQTASADPAVSSWPARIDVIPEAGELVAGVPNIVYVLVARLDGAPVQQGRVKLGTGETADLDANGAASFTVLPSPSQMSFNLTAMDAGGATIAVRDAMIPVGRSDDFLVRTDRAVYRGGDTMKITAVGSGPVFVDLLRDGQTLWTETIDTAGGRGEAAVDLPAEMAGTVQVVGYRLDAKGYPVRKTRVVYVQPADEVHIAATLDPGKPTYKPGERPTLRLKLIGKDGKPSPGAVSLAGVDEAVFSVLPQKPGMERAFYTLDEELMAPVEKLRPWSPGEAGSPRFEQALFAAASQADADNREIGATHTLVAETYQAKVQETESLRADRLIWIKQGWVALGLTAIAMGVFAFWLFVRASILVKSLVTGYVAMPFLLFAFLVYLANEGFVGGGIASKVGMRTALFGYVTDLQEDRSAAAASVDLPVHAANITMADMGAPPADPVARIRQAFPETLLWRPEVVTDDAGEATLPLDLADSITTWRLSAGAVTADGRLGAVQMPVKVFQDFFVDLNLPVALTRGDEIGVPVVVYNYLDKPQTVTFTLGDDGESWFTRLEPTEKRLELAPNEVRSVRYRLRVDKVGAWTLTVAAHGATDADAVRRSVDVEPDGRPVEEAANGTLEKSADVAFVLPENAVPGSGKAFVKVYPSTFSQLVEGLDGVFRMPNGCFEQTSSTTYPNVLALDYLKRTGRNAPEVRAKAEGFIHLGYQRLVGFEVPGGGFDWFGRAPANRTLTAYGLMEFEDMAHVHYVDPQMIQRTRAWLLAQRRPDGSWDPEAHQAHDAAVGDAPGDDARLAETAYVAWALFSDPAASAQAAPTFAYLKSRNAAGVRDPHTLALVCNALLAADDHNGDAAPYLDRLEGMRRFSEDGKFVWWEQAPGARTTFYGAGRGGAVETTALATLALLRAGRNPDAARKALAWLISQKDPNGTWYSTQATVLALKALLAGTGKPLAGDGERVVEIRLNGEVVRTLSIPADQAEVLKQADLSPLLKPGKQVVTLTEAHGSAVGFQTILRYNTPDAADPQGPFAVELKYDRTELSVGEQVEAKASVRNRTAEATPMVMVELPVPPGFVSAADDFAAPHGKVAKVQVRPQSVLLYLTGLDAGEKLELTYHLRATTPVKATAAGAHVYEYYDPDKQESSPATRFAVNARD